MCNVSYAVSYLMEDSGINSDLLVPVVYFVSLFSSSILEQPVENNHFKLFLPLSLTLHTHAV